MRRTPAAIGACDTIVMIPISPVRATWVPPQSSTEKGGPSEFWPFGLARMRKTHRHDANLVAIFFPEESAGAGANGFIDAHQTGHDGRVLEDGVIGDVLDAHKFVRADRLLMGKIEAQPVGSHERSFLRHMAAENLAERLVQKMRRRMVGAHRLPALVIDDKLKRQPNPQLALLDHAFMDKKTAEFFLGVVDTEAHAMGKHRARITDLPARFAIKGRLIEDDGTGLARAKSQDLLAVLDDRGDKAFRALHVITQKFGGSGFLLDGEP